MRPSFTVSAILILVLVVIAGVRADQADHHAFLAGTSEVPPGGRVSIQINHTLFAWATIWYSARVQYGSPIRAFIVDADNYEALEADGAFSALDGTASGPAADAGGLAPSLPSGTYYLVLEEPAPSNATVKWEIFLEPRLAGDARTSGPTAPWYANRLLPWVAGAAAVAAGLFLARRRIKAN